MASAPEHRRKGVAGRPFLLAAGLGLFWFAETPQGGLPIDAPALGLMLVPMSRLLLDLVGGWVAVSGVRIILALGRLGMIRWYTPGAEGTR
ncbi:MAG: hypothetical protein ACREE4_03405 [Stellaceae bacterium]